MVIDAIASYPIYIDDYSVDFFREIRDACDMMRNRCSRLKVRDLIVRFVYFLAPRIFQPIQPALECLLFVIIPLLFLIDRFLFPVSAARNMILASCHRITFQHRIVDYVLIQLFIYLFHAYCPVFFVVGLFFVSHRAIGYF